MHVQSTCGQAVCGGGLRRVQRGKILLNAMLKIAQHRGIDVELPLQVGACRSFHGDVAVTPACPCRRQFAPRFFGSWCAGSASGGGRSQDRTRQKKKPHSHREGKAREGDASGNMASERGGGARRHDWPGPRKDPRLRGQDGTGLDGEKQEPREGGIGTGQDKNK